MTEIEQMKTTVLAAGDINLSNFHLAKNVQKQALVKVEKNALQWISSLITTIESLQEDNSKLIQDTSDLIDTKNTLIESQKEEIERLTQQIKRAHSSLTWSNTENQIPHAIYHLEQAVPVEPDSPEYVAAAKIFLQEGEKP